MIAPPRRHGLFQRVPSYEYLRIKTSNRCDREGSYQPQGKKDKLATEKKDSKTDVSRLSPSSE